MPTRRRYTFAFPSDLAARLEATVPPRQRSRFVVEAVEARLRQTEREELRAEMEECARVMEDEIRQIQAEFEPLDLEVDRLL